jgi:DNA-binding transcriptional LysR family regulator
MPLEARQLRYFIAVADELNFTRAAERLHVVQQSLSTAIAQLETTLGVKLFERSTRTVALTEVGASWLPLAREVAAVDRADEAARDLAAGHTGRLRVGLAATAALDLTPSLLRAFADLHPLIELRAEHFDFQDPTGGLRARRSDVAIVRPPFTNDGLELAVIATEPRYAVMASDHPLADRTATEFVELVDQPRMEIASDPIWCNFWRVTARRSKPPTLGATGRTLDDLLEAARAGRAIGLCRRRSVAPSGGPAARSSR